MKNPKCLITLSIVIVIVLTALIVGLTLIDTKAQYNERSFTGDQTEIYRTSLPVALAGKK